MFFVWHPYMWWPLIDPCYHFLWDGKKYKYLLHLRSHRGKCHSFLHRPARSDSYPVGGPLHKKRWLLPQTYLEVGDKKEAGNDVRLLCDKGRAQRSQKFIMDDARLASVRGGHSGNRHGGWKKNNETQKLVTKVLTFKECQIAKIQVKETSCSNPTVQVTRPRPNSGGGRQHRQIPVYTWLVVVDDDEFLRVVIR